MESRPRWYRIPGGGFYLLSSTFLMKTGDSLLQNAVAGNMARFKSEFFWTLALGEAFVINAI